MKLWERYLADAIVDLTKQYRDIAEGREDCKGISCAFCPLKEEERPCDKIPFTERLALWHKEVAE